MWILVKIVLLILSSMPLEVLTLICSRYPSHTFTPKSPVDENFVISIQGNPQTYILGQEYNISLNAYNGLRYISFSLVLENEEGDTTYHEDLGHFEVSDPVETRYSPNCINMVESTNTNPKNRIDVSWIAPTEPGVGCILIRATVLQHRDVWFMDDGGLTKKICEEVVDDVESKKFQQTMRPCCACDEARYELTFEGIWSRNLHPKDFPSKGWTTRFTDIIGAAHSGEYRFWEYGALATPAMKEYGEFGSSISLENELNMNFRNGQIRTIIKARGPSFPNLNGQSVASVRVDPQHHLISLASKIEPSPDWIVGVSGLQLCHSNCTWLEHKVINLYPWDLGTDAGPSYTSPNQPQVPPDVIRRIRSDFPNDPRSPFFDETGAPMKPLASLTIRRQRLYERSCPDEESNNIGVPRECFTHPWTDWSECTAQCGEGKQYRSRVYKQPEVAKIYECDQQIQKKEDRNCTGMMCGESADLFRRNSFQNSYLGQDVELFNNENDQSFNRLSSAECQLSSWGPWSSCNVTCGEGKMYRTRQYINKYSEQKCQNARFSRLIDFKKCMGDNCLGEISNQRNFYNSLDETNENLYQNRKTSEDFYGKTNYGSMRTWNQNYPQQNFGSPPNNQEMEEVYESPRIYEHQAFVDNNEMPAENLQRNFPPNREENDLSNSPYSLKPKKNFGYENRYENSKHQFNEKEKSSVEDLPSHRNPSYNSDRWNSRYQQNPNEAHRFDQSTSPFENPNENPQIFPHNNQVFRNENPPHEPQSGTPSYCFESLQIFNCLDPTVVGNFWFYNFCEDECMLFAADSCDKNNNKFSSLEMCEMRCRHPAAEDFLHQLQNEQCPNKRRYKEGSLRSGRRKWRY